MAFRASTRQLYLANVWLRIATRVLVRVGEFRATSFAALEARLDELDVGPWLAPGVPLEVTASSHASALYHTGAIVERVQRVVGPHGGGTLFVRADHDRFTVSADSSGEALHRRGWRLATAKAPLRPTIAAAMVIASGWDQSSPLVDPLCGAGTIAIEAALIAARRPPSLGRAFAFERWSGFEPGTWASVRATTLAAEGASPPVIVMAGDRDQGAVDSARANAERASVAPLIEFTCCSVSETLDRAPKDSYIITNPPFDRRVRGAAALVRTLASGQTADVGVLLADPKLAPKGSIERFRTTSGGIAVWFYTRTSRV